jgi:hypothetical protein
MYPDPKTQESVLLISEAEPLEDALSSYEPKNLERLDTFQPKEQTVASIDEKLTELYTDLSINVTHIYERQDLHLAIDLSYHSCLLYNPERLTKGWVEVLILGDSSQGKTESSLRLMEHYGLGERVECKNATVAGLLGGLQQFSGKWFVSWGIIPKHDKRLVILEELKGTSTEVIGKLTDMRSSGIAELPKIEKRKTHARTRLIAISNPRSESPLSSYNFGIEAVYELIGGLEDIRRFDLCLIVSAEQVDVRNLVNKRDKVDHKYTSELCRALLLWIWSRTETQVLFTAKANGRIISASIELCDIFSEKLPIVDRGSIRHKLARLSIALAGRLFSHVGYTKIMVRECHVEYIVQMLIRMYSESHCGYKDFSDAANISRKLLSPKEIKSRLFQAPFPGDVIEQLIHTHDIELVDIQDWCGWPRPEAMQLLSFLVRKHALIRDGRVYHKSPKFIDLLKELRGSPELAKFDRPEHVKEF